MAAQNFLTEQQILEEIQRAAQPTNDGKPKIKVGDQEFSIENAQAIQDAINNSLTRNQTEFDALRAQVTELSNSRFVKPEVENTPPVVQQPQQPRYEPRKPRNISDEEWAAQFVKSPQITFQETLNDTLSRMLGTDIDGLKQALTGIAAELQTSNLERKALLTKAQELDQKIVQTEAERHAQRFIDSHPEYEISTQNQQVIEQYLKDYNLPATYQNLDLVYQKAKADGKVKVAEAQPQQNQQFGQQQPQAPQRQGVPRLGGQSFGNQDEGYILEQANKLPLDEHFALIERLRNGTYQR